MNEPVDPRAGRFDPLVRGARVAVAAAFGLALLGIVVPSPAGPWFATAAIAVVLVAPLARIVWLGTRWFRRGDPRYGWVAVGVLCVVTAGVVLAAV